MNKLAQQMEILIRNSSCNSFDITSGGSAFISNDSSSFEMANLNEIANVFTIHKDDYEDGVLYKIPDDFLEEFNKYLESENVLKMAEIVENHGVPFSKEVSKLFGSAVLLLSQGCTDMAQTIFDQVYAAGLRKKFYPVAFESIRENAYRKKMIENACKPRNKNYEVAVRILKRTWAKHPGAPKKSLFKAVKNHLNGGVSEDSLRAWAKAEGISPDPLIKKTSFTLVVD